VAGSFFDTRIKLIQQKNAGGLVARNAGISLSRSALIAFIDADDAWDARFLQTIVGLRHSYPKAKVYATSYRYRYRSGAAYNARLTRLDRFGGGLLNPYFQIAVQSDPPIFTSAVAVDRAALLHVGGFPIGVASGEDLLTLAKLPVHFPIAYDDGVLVDYNMSEIRREADPAKKWGKNWSSSSEMIGKWSD
jgi:glycosyltransferase involved in cell wall biosynthesis